MKVYAQILFFVTVLFLPLCGMQREKAVRGADVAGLLENPQPAKKQHTVIDLNSCKGMQV